MILYQYRCEKCDKTFEAMSAVEKRSQHPCPSCGTMAKKTLGAAKADVNFRPGWFNNIAPVPVYLESREQFTRVANMCGNYANRPFCKQESMPIRQPKGHEKKQLVERLKRGDY